jgi:hypothetical protein
MAVTLEPWYGDEGGTALRGPPKGVSKRREEDCLPTFGAGTIDLETNAEPFE